MTPVFGLRLVNQPEKWRPIDPHKLAVRFPMTGPQPFSQLLLTDNSPAVLPAGFVVPLRTAL